MPMDSIVLYVSKSLTHGRFTVRALFDVRGRVCEEKNRSNEPVKVIQFVTQMESGGAQRVAVLLHRELLNRGVDSSVYFLYEKRPTYVGEPGVASLAGEKPRSVTQRARLLVRATGVLVRSRPDVLITHMTPPTLLLQPVASILRIRHRIAVHHTPAESVAALPRSLDRIFGSVGLLTTIGVVSPSVLRSMRAYPTRYLNRVRVMPNGVSMPPATVSRDEFRKRLNIPTGSPMILNVGRLSPLKNQGFLVSAMQFLPGVHLVIAGEGELRGELERAVEHSECRDRIHLVGEIAPEHVGSLMRSADAFVFPSRETEAMPMALVEAMTSNLPVIVSDVPPHRDLLAPDGTGTAAGVLVATSSPEPFAQAVLDVLADRRVAEGLAARGRAVAARYTVAAMASQYESCWRTPPST